MSDFDDRAFPEIACEALHSWSLHGRITYDDVIDWVAQATVLPTQTDLEAAFGEPPVVVSSDSRFHIGVLFWATGTTALHQHSFSGAFTVLSGSSVQSQYRFIVPSASTSTCCLAICSCSGAESSREEISSPFILATG